MMTTTLKIEGRGFTAVAMLLSILAATPLPAQQNGSAPIAKTKRESLVTGNPIKPAPETDWAKQIKRPVDWLSWGADLRLRHEYVDNPYLIDSDPPGSEWSYNRYRARLWTTILPNAPVDFNLRMTWEGRYWFEPESKEGLAPNEVIWDNLNVRLKLGDPKKPWGTITAGRQDILLGDGWLVFETTPLDGSRSFYFDAVRLQLETGKVTTNLIYIENRVESDAWLRPINSDNKCLVEQDERGFILNVSGKPTEKTTMDGYFIYKQMERVLANGDEGEDYTIGGRVAHEFDKNWCARLEAAYQFGSRKNDVLFPGSNGELSAFGALGRVTYSFNDAWKNQVYLEGEFLSGDDPNTKRNEQFDMLWGRWPQYSELYIYTAVADSRLAETSNLGRVNVGWKICPSKQLSVCAAYHALFAPENPRAGRAGFGDGCFRGHLFTAGIKYQFNEFTTGRLIGEYLLPGDYYDGGPGSLSSRDDSATFLRAELIFAF